MDAGERADTDLNLLAGSSTSRRDVVNANCSLGCPAVTGCLWGIRTEVVGGTGIVAGHGLAAQSLIVNDIGSLGGTYLVSDGMVLFQISSDGDWRVSKE